jgi:hypothetical protein
MAERVAVIERRSGERRLSEQQRARLYPAALVVALTLVNAAVTHFPAVLGVAAVAGALLAAPLRHRWVASALWYAAGAYTAVVIVAFWRF